MTILITAVLTILAVLARNSASPPRYAARSSRTTFAPTAPFRRQQAGCHASARTSRLTGWRGRFTRCMCGPRPVTRNAGVTLRLLHRLASETLDSF